MEPQTIKGEGKGLENLLEQPTHPWNHTTIKGDGRVPTDLHEQPTHPWNLTTTLSEGRDLADPLAHPKCSFTFPKIFSIENLEVGGIGMIS